MTSYNDALALLRESFIGGGEGAFYVDTLASLAAREIDWLEVGVGSSAQSVMPFVRSLGDAGRTVRLVGVDPDAQPDDVELGLSRIRLVRERFEDFPLTEAYTVVSMDQSLYYLRDPRAQLARATSALRPGGVLIVTCWSSGDTMYGLHRALLEDASTEVTGEAVYDWLVASEVVSDVHRELFRSQVDLARWRRSRSHLQAALTILLRGRAPDTVRPALVERLDKMLDGADAYGVRLNVALRARRKAASGGQQPC